MQAAGVTQAAAARCIHTCPRPALLQTATLHTHASRMSTAPLACAHTSCVIMRLRTRVQSIPVSREPTCSTPAACHPTCPARGQKANCTLLYMYMSRGYMAPLVCAHVSHAAAHLRSRVHITVPRALVQTFHAACGPCFARGQRPICALLYVYMSRTCMAPLACARVSCTAARLRTRASLVLSPTARARDIAFAGLKACLPLHPPQSMSPPDSSVCRLCAAGATHVHAAARVSLAMRLRSCSPTAVPPLARARALADSLSRVERASFGTGPAEVPAVRWTSPSATSRAVP